MPARFLAFSYFQFRSVAKKFTPERGLTLIELLTVLVLTAIILLMSGEFLMNFYRNREAGKVAMQLQEQAEYAMNRMIHGVTKRGYREEGLMWASSCTIDPGDPNKISFSFRDHTDHDRLIVYEEREKKLIRILAGNPNVVIPYLDGSQEYRHGPYNVSVKFRKNQEDPNRLVSIELRVEKDGAEFNLRSSVALRNYAQ